MNILIINDTAHINGGAAKLAIAEAVGLADRGHTVNFLSAVRPVSAELENHPNICVTNTDQYDLISDPNKLRAFLQGLWNRKAANTTRQILQRSDSASTVVHLHVWSRALSSSVARVALDAGFATVCTLHDFVLACPTGTFFVHPEESICTRRPLSVACVSCNCDTRGYAQKLWRVGRHVVQDRIGHIPSHLTEYIVHSELAASIMTPYLPADSRVHSLDVYIDAEKMPPASPADNEGFAYLGRFVREKGVMILARSAAAENLPVTFIGSGPLAQQIQEACPQAKITGWVDSADCVGHLRNARALVFPSLWYETLGLVVLEAAAHGIPSVVSNNSAAREFVHDGVTGLHFKGGDEADLRAKMLEINNPAFALRLGREAYSRFWASPFHSLDSHAKSLELIYTKALMRAGFAFPPNSVLEEVSHAKHATFPPAERRSFTCTSHPGSNSWRNNEVLGKHHSGN